jgi:hypothetical protein
MKNPFPVREAPNFVPYEDGMQRGVAVWPGHEYLVIRKEDLEPGDGLRAGDFGITDDSWVFVIRDTTHVAAMQVSSNALNGRLLRTPEQIRVLVDEIHNGHKPSGPQWLRGVLDFCTSYPIEEQVRGGPIGSDCFLQVRGKHFPGDSTILGGNPVVLPLDDILMDGPPEWWTANHEVVRAHLLELTNVWVRLEAWFTEQRQNSMLAAIRAPRQCPHCLGAGTVPKLSSEKKQ